MITIPNLSECDSNELTDKKTTYVQDRWPFATLDNACPPSIQFNIVKPIILIKLKITGRMIP